MKGFEKKQHYNCKYIALYSFYFTVILGLQVLLDLAL
jgi:hypothetical protein